jgi:hypothetical protein
MNPTQPGPAFVAELDRRWRGRVMDGIPPLTLKGFDLASDPAQWPPRVRVRFEQLGLLQVSDEDAVTGGWDARHVRQAVDFFENVNLFWLRQRTERSVPASPSA